MAPRRFDADRFFFAVERFAADARVAADAFLVEGRFARVVERFVRVVARVAVERFFVLERAFFVGMPIKPPSGRGSPL